MSAISRRAAILAVPAAGTIAIAHASPGDQVISFTAKRSKDTLPVSPPLGAPFIIYYTLLDPTGGSVGDGSLLGMVVDVVVDVPPKIVVQTKSIFRLPGGEIHVSGMEIRKVPDPGVKRPIAVVGGTGIYASARGEGTIEHQTADLSAVSLTVTTG
ncbi:hypothetical protein [Actinocrispum sp. NPDC049592]|uniref:hypothetical protein n=1 Tax=Actinocrispum sp. NPDC049592 TaxID=3154835 RepID=UPI00342A88ED